MASQKFGLGKGLGALIPETAMPQDEGAAPSGGVSSLAIDRVAPNPEQPRKRFDDVSIAELAESIKRHGVIQPLIVEADGSGAYSIIAGERRWRAARLAGLQEVPAIIREFGREKRLEVALVENVQREDLNPIDEAEAYRQLMEATGLTQEQVAERVGKSRPAVANSLRLLNLPAPAMEALRSGAMSPGHARTVLSVVNPADQKALLARIVDDGISVREAEALAADLNRGGRAVASAQKKKPEPRALDPDLAVIEQRLIERFGTKVAIRGDAKRGSLVVEYFSMEDLERVLGIMEGDGP